MNNNTAANGAKAAKRSWRMGDKLRHQARQRCAKVLSLDSASSSGPGGPRGSGESGESEEVNGCMAASVGAVMAFLGRSAGAEKCAVAAIFQIMK